MALIDLAQYDILDLILASKWSEEEQMEIVKVYTEAFSVALSDAIGSELKEGDQAEMDKLMQDPTVTWEMIMKFYTDRIPQLEEKIVYLAMSFKKAYVLDVYKSKLEEYKTAQNNDGLAAWEQIFKDGLADNWNEVVRLLKIVETMPSSPTPAATISQ
ncbi:hypothetical protein A2773_05540 [Candidatus Gottesmanbacteria bacterium RIFCSPHIGHO2_01_FULL_39_10]|uniref:Uncharacterized protein n=1 Tax=Candidatus Gottesmanbacteria bacterium RIFCSPHIGHO2_01_FULL_39_10 TaxID=1798375 RepID=A0A1F5ZQB8_9BACT|nr:MAG: hypothetical protein A2773_05540 [Candidatus Gottesmanbacteria bacterium RIFCSPHIGHO2_01_FULL_39_10]